MVGALVGEKAHIIWALNVGYVHRLGIALISGVMHGALHIVDTFATTVW